MAGCSLARSLRSLGKPSVIGEAGAQSDSPPGTRVCRTLSLGVRVNAFFADGGAGYIIWKGDTLVDTAHRAVLAGAAPLPPFLRDLIPTPTGR